MNRQAEAAAIRRLEAEYTPATERFELEDWIAGQLFDTYHDIHEGHSILFRFREAVLLYVPTTELINVTVLVGKNVVEHCVLLSQFLQKNYGVSRLGNKADIEMALMLSEHDFELMAMQIVEDLVTWYDKVSCVKDVLARRGLLTKTEENL
jgi:hypothetical protein